MIPFPPNRIEQLIAKVENGEPVGKADLDRLAFLSQLDMASYARNDVEDFFNQHEEHFETLMAERRSFENVLFSDVLPPSAPPPSNEGKPANGST